MSPEESMKVSSWPIRGAIGALSLMIIGWLLGMMTDRFVIAREPSAETARARFHQAAMASFREELGLSEEKTAEIHEIFRRHQAEFDESWEVIRAQLRARIQSVHDEIRGLLTPEQRARFEDWLRRYIEEDPMGDPARRWLH